MIFRRVHKSQSFFERPLFSVQTVQVVYANVPCDCRRLVMTDEMAVRAEHDDLRFFVTAVNAARLMVILHAIFNWHAAPDAVAAVAVVNLIVKFPGLPACQVDSLLFFEFHCRAFFLFVRCLYTRNLTRRLS